MRGSMHDKRDASCVDAQPVPRHSAIAWQTRIGYRLRTESYWRLDGRNVSPDKVVCLETGAHIVRQGLALDALVIKDVGVCLSDGRRCGWGHRGLRRWRPESGGLTKSRWLHRGRAWGGRCAKGGWLG